MPKKPVIIVGSSRTDGNTQRIAQQIAEQAQLDMITLADYDFSYYDYLHQNKEDDFLPLMKKLIENYDTFIFATPVYWYAMSGIMKVFIDRFADLLEIQKPMGRQLKDKKLMVISNSSSASLDYPFALPFERTAQYLDMQYIGHQHYPNTIEKPTLHLSTLINS